MARNGTDHPPGERAAPDDGGAPPVPKRVRVPLRSIDDVRAELARIYRAAKARHIDVADASKLANILSILGRLIEGSTLEERLDRLEAAQPEQRWHAPH